MFSLPSSQNIKATKTDDSYSLVYLMSINYRYSKFELCITFVAVYIFFPCHSSSAINNQGKEWVQEDKTMQKVEFSNLGSRSGFIGKSWCDTKLCSRDACAEEEFIRTQAVKPGSIKNKTIHFSKQKMREEAFERIFYSSRYLMHIQKLIVVTTSYGYPPRYSLSWIDWQPWPVFVSTKEAGFGFASEPWGNVGQEIASYIRFILMFWNHLPEHIAFVHGHEKAWHQEGYRMSYMLRHICLDKFEYASLNAFENEAWRPIKGARSYFNIIKRYWKLVEPYLGAMPKYGFKEKCCSQFVVSRKRIKARPRELYELILKQMTDPKKNYRRAPHGKNNGWDLIHFWEAIWHYIFGEDALINTRKKYGYGVDMNIETGHPLSKLPQRTLKLFIACEVDHTSGKIM